jgi:hypothetical protein
VKAADHGESLNKEQVRIMGNEHPDFSWQHCGHVHRYSIDEQQMVVRKKETVQLCATLSCCSIDHVLRFELEL